jgi:NTE family protein
MAGKKRIGLALGGGGARGLAHLGLLRVLIKAGIKPSVIAGTSMGTIIAAGYSQEKDFSRLETRFKEFVLHFGDRFAGMDFLEKKSREELGIFGDILHAVSKKAKMAAFVKKLSLNNGEMLEEIAQHFFRPCNLEDLPVPIYAAALDMVSGKAVFLNRGNAQMAVKAAISIAGYFPGIKLEDMELYDAQGVFPVPIQVFQGENVDIIIACSADRKIEPGYRAGNVVDLLFRQNEIASHHIISEIHNCSDLVIEPDLEEFHWTDFRKMDTIVKRGLEAGEKALPHIEKMLQGKTPLVPVEKRPWNNSGYKDGKRFVLTGFACAKTGGE